MEKKKRRRGIEMTMVPSYCLTNYRPFVRIFERSKTIFEIDKKKFEHVSNFF